MNALAEISPIFVNWSLGLTVLIGLAASEFSGVVTIIALPITALSITVSALCGSSITTDDTYKKRKLCDILQFLRIWTEILEILAASATCARIASATVDYISNGRFREWFLGLESHSLGEPWPDVLGVSVVIVITILFMLGLEKSTSFSLLLCVALLVTFGFFLSVGSTHIVISLSKWREDLNSSSAHSVLMAAAMCSFGFVNTLPKIKSHACLKVPLLVLIPFLLYTSTVMVFSLMSHSNELAGTATPLLRVFEMRDVDWARLVMAICIISVVCLALTEMLPSLYGLFVTLASKEWQIFLTSLQYRNSLTGAPMLAIFAAGSLAAILAFACPLAYLVKILNAATLLKCIIQSFQVLYYCYRPESRSDCYLGNSTNLSYSKLKQSNKSSKEISLKNKVVGVFSGLKKNISTAASSSTHLNKNKEPLDDDEYLLLDDYCAKSMAVVMSDDSSDEFEEKESVLSSDIEESYSSTDIDAAVQEYKDKIQIATIDGFNNSRSTTYVSATTVAIFLSIIIITMICLAQVITLKRLNLLWPCFTALFFSTLIILVMPKNVCHTENQILPELITPLTTLFSLALNILLIETIMREVWPGFVFWFSAGCLLFWRCECCTCDGLISDMKYKRANENNDSQYEDQYIDTIFIAR